MKRPTCRGLSMASQETTDQQEESCRYMERLEVDGNGTGERDVGAYDDEEEEDDDDLAGGGARGGAGGLGEKKRRLASEQVRALERSFEADNKLDPERKARIARDLLLHPRQVAVWFQNRRARWKTKQIERDFTALRSRHDALRHECDSLRRDKDALAAEIRELREKVEINQEIAVKLEQKPSSAAAAAIYKQDGSTDSDSSAVLNEEASPYSGAAFDQHNHPPQLSFTGFTSFLGAPSSALTLSSSFPSLYNGSHFDQDDALLLGATAADELGGAGLFATDQEHTGGLSWYGGQGW
ncbi:homeobox-leucine zipper protein HOX8-like [Lolium rigidum]|uniref:homeobox-leucine zipper protein HOX8-like n=1 Tax=Lolium rigidum TaxID=89674 RepID=UPI001F5C4795|nr:homeobox-leucine zipper protein HOX8-like [Lolium rigidum]